ncbi:MAG: hypothetical protein ABWY52_08155 [Candidatus Limnocylindrales bacterium]
MFINDLTDLDCEACGEAVDVVTADFEPVVPLLCERCLAQLVNDEDVHRDLPAAA